MSEQSSRNPDRNTWGRRCDLGCESWPDRMEFAKCLRCGEETTRFSNLQPLPLSEALALLAHAKFNAYYSTRCYDLRIPVDGPLPDWYEPAADLIGGS